MTDGNGIAVDLADGDAYVIRRYRVHLTSRPRPCGFQPAGAFQPAGGSTTRLRGEVNSIPHR